MELTMLEDGQVLEMSKAQDTDVAERVIFTKYQKNDEFYTRDS